MIKLIETTDHAIYRGQVIKFYNAKRDDSLCLMLCEIIGDEGYELLKINGYKAGLRYYRLPLESLSKDKFGLDTKWLIDNYNVWGFLDYSIDDVYILDEPTASMFDY